MRNSILVFFFLFLGWVSALAQDNNLAVDATVKDSDGGRLQGAVINLYQDGSLINKVTAGRNGRFDLILDFEHEYVIEVGKAGFVSKRLYFNTHNVPEDEQVWGYEFGGFIVDLFRDVPGIDFSVLDDPIGKVYYEARIQNFEYDRQYTKQLKEQLAQLEDEYKAKIRQLEQLEKQREEDYQLAMRDGQLALEAKDFLTAKENFLAASSMNPEATEPAKKIAEVEIAIQKESGTEEKYLAALASADQLLEDQQYAEAKIKYNEALGIKPNESYPKTQLKKCNEGIELLAKQRQEQEKQKQIDEKYQRTIELADKEFEGEAYQAAKRLYTEALAIKANEDYPQLQLTKIDGLIASVADAEAERKAKEEADKKYADMLARADGLLKKGEYQPAIEGYEQALAIRPDDNYPKEKIEEAKAGIEQQKLAQVANEKQEEYRALIAEADNQLASKDLTKARESYTKAIELKPNEQYPKDQLAAIDVMEQNLAEAAASKAKEAEREAEYQALIADADESFGAGAYEVAAAKYNEAKKLKPKDPYPDQQLEAIKAKEAELQNLQKAEESRQKLQRDYDELIAKADKLFEDEKYSDAASTYQKAQQLKPKEVYPKTQIDIIALRLKDASDAEKAELALQQTNEAYNTAIAAADRALAANNLDNAENGYREAASLKPSEKYPEEQLAVIADRRKELLAAQALDAAKKQKRTDYEAIVSKADKAYESERLEEAKRLYTDALGVLSEEQYPKDRISQIDDELLKMEQDKEQRALKQEETAEYDALISEADKMLKDNELERSKEKYASALQIKPSEVYPKNQMAKINQLMSQRADAEAKKLELQERYDNWIRKGDAATAAKKWDEARTAYQEALKLFPDEKIPRDRLLEIGNLEDREKETKRKEAYDELISEADQLFLNQDFEAAQVLYEKSLKYFPNADHPKERIGRIGKILEELNQKYTEEERKQEKTIVEESYMEGNRKITVRTVTIGDKQEVYKRIIHPWGGKYYFLDNTPISELIWTRETTAK